MVILTGIQSKKLIFLTKSLEELLENGVSFAIQKLEDAIPNHFPPDFSGKKLKKIQSSRYQRLESPLPPSSCSPTPPLFATHHRLTLSPHHPQIYDYYEQIRCEDKLLQTSTSTVSERFFQI
ncbi:unnamed protein product [Citrullus colocynthis]|uniref:Uncharacterized protein n=1 Tax=Citrullus colocynthis TaxID=252529 RepID=A0ABP0Y3L1_9ROSI